MRFVDAGVVPVYSPIATNCAVCPTIFTVWLAGTRLIDVRPVAVDDSTVTVAVPAMSAPPAEADFAVIVAVPAPTAVARPTKLTVTTWGSLESHVAWLVRSFVAGVTPV